MFEIEEVMNTCAENLLRYATSILCNHHDAEDVVQQVFLLAHKNRSSFDGKNLNAWLYKITFNKCMDFKKKRKWQLFSDVRVVQEDTENPYETDHEAGDALEMLRGLKPLDRALLHGKIIDEKSYDELSDILGKSPTALRKKYERAKKKLAVELEKYYIERNKINGCKPEQA